VTVNTEVQLSIVTVCWNDLANVQHTIESLKMQKADAGWEHILMDGASSDGTADWYQSAGLGFPHRLVCEPDNGIFDAMNKSLDITRGDYIIFMNAGDRFADDGAVERVLNRIEAQPAWGYSKARMVNGDGQKVRPDVGHKPYSRFRHLFRLAQICHQAVVMRVDFLRDLGGFDLRMGHASDYHLLIKAASRESPSVWDEVDVDYLVGGVSDREVYRGLWLGHRIRVDALALKPIGAGLDRAWTASQVANVWARKKLKPVLGQAYWKLRNR